MILTLLNVTALCKYVGNYSTTGMVENFDIRKKYVTTPSTSPSLMNTAMELKRVSKKKQGMAIPFSYMYIKCGSVLD